MEPSLEAHFKIDRSNAAEGALTNDTFYYFDPPFFKKAKELYAFWFPSDEHVRFRDEVLPIHKPWIISYDSSPRVMELYLNGATNGTRVQSLYSGSSGELKNCEEAIVTNLETLPQQTRFWRTKEEWLQSADIGSSRAGFVLQ